MKTVYTLIGVCGFLAILLMMSLTTHCFGAPLVDMYGTPVPQGGTTDIGVHEYVLARAGTYDAKTSTVKLDTAKEVVITGLAEKAPIKVDGKLDKVTPQRVKAEPGKLIRVWYQTDKKKTISEANGKGEMVEVETGEYLWAWIDGIGAELMDGKFVIVYKSGTKEEFTTKDYRFYQIDGGEK